MKHVLSKSLVLASLLVFSACDKGGGGGGGATAQATVPGAPQGVVPLQTDSTSYCSFSGSAFSCAGKNYMGAVCSTNTVSFTSIQDMCNQLTNLQSSMNTMTTNTITNGCNVTQISSQVYQSYCANINQNGLGGLGGGGVMPTTGAGMYKIQCNVDGYSNSTHTSIQGGVVTYNFSGAATVNVVYPARKFFGGSRPGVFGSTTLSFRPAGFLKGSADTITLNTTGMAGLRTLTQSGYAGDAVSMAVDSDNGDFTFSISCAGQSGNFRKNAATSTMAQYVCRGTSNLYGSRSENVERLISLSSAGLDIGIANNVTASVDSSGHMTFTAKGVGQGLNLQTSTNLTSTSKLTAGDDVAQLNLTCGPR